MTKRLRLIKPEPLEHEIERFTEHMYASGITQFAIELDLARSMWRKHQALVEAPDFPQYLAEPLRGESGEEPGDSTIHDDFMQADHRDHLRQETVKFLRKQRRNAA